MLFMPLSIVWLKRDLRLHDHEPLQRAIAAGQPVLLVYVFEPDMVNDPHLSERHFRFITQSLDDLRRQCPDIALWVKRAPVLEVLKALHQEFGISALFSHQEVGLDYTFKRDLAVAEWCKNRGIDWSESPTGAVVRGLTHRRNWDKHWHQVMRAKAQHPDVNNAQWLIDVPTSDTLPTEWQQPDENFQTGGETSAWATLNDFYAGRGQHYFRQLSSPLTAETACSRLSPYLAWGNISLRQVYHTVLKSWKRPGWRRTLMAFSSRLHWHCHFIQKFESESEMEFRHLNPGYNDMPLTTGDQAQQHLKAWQQGQTGIPMVDACMRCLQTTGYINFRMRAMLVSFLTHHLALDWRLGVTHLARLFLDFEPGIHYAQFQMQAGVTGINTIRLYNPIKQGQEKDPEGQFISRWCPELAELPVNFIHQPWELTAMEQQLYDFSLGKDYPAPIIDVDAAAKTARDRLWSWRKKPQVLAHKKRILNRHAAPKTKFTQ